VTPFSLLLFSVDPTFIREAVAGGVQGIVVDWERVGKERRQASADTEINQHTLADLRAVRATTEAQVICRINGVHARTAEEVELALEAGADELLVPMVRHVAEVQTVLGLVRGRAKVGILVETDAAVRGIGALALLPLSRIYVGLNDLAIDRRSDHIFRAVADGTVEAVSREVTGSFGFGGLTLPEEGSPVPCRLLMGELVRLGGSFSLLRRSFHRAVRGGDVRRGVEHILEAVERCAARSHQEQHRDREELLAVIRSLPGLRETPDRSAP
jgi:hypothetical protein